MTTTKTYFPILIQAVRANANLEYKRFVGFDGNYCQAGAKALGVIDVSTEKDQLCPYAALGILMVVAGGNISVGSPVTSDAEGKAVAATNNDSINGYALDSAVSGDEIRIIRGI